MTKRELKGLAVCGELLWWAGLIGLFVESVQQPSFGLISISAMCVSLRIFLFCATNGWSMTLSALLRLVQKYRDEK